MRKVCIMLIVVWHAVLVDSTFLDLFLCGPGSMLHGTSSLYKQARAFDALSLSWF